MIRKGMDESYDGVEDVHVDVTPVIVETSKLQNTKIKRNMHTTALLDLGSMAIFQ